MFVPRRWGRVVVQILLFLVVAGGMLFVLDVYTNFLPPAVQTRLPLHLAAPVVTDVRVQSCFRASTCAKLGKDGWYQHPKDLYLGKSWVKKAYLYTMRVPEGELTSDTKVVLGVALNSAQNVAPQEIIDQLHEAHEDVDPLDTASVEAAAAKIGWVFSDKDFGLWVKYGKYRPEKSVSALKVLFGNDAVYPLPGWHMLSGVLQIGPSYIPPRLAVRIGGAVAPTHPALKVSSETHVFRIAQLADLHMVTGDGVCDHPVGFTPTEDEPCRADSRTMEFVGRVLDEEKPDLVVYTGDQIFGPDAADPESAILKALGPTIERHIPFALVFGNHDDQGPLSNAQMMDIISNLPYSLASAGSSNASGVGNYVLTATVNNHPALTMYFLDSHSTLTINGQQQQGCIEESQLQFVDAAYRELEPQQAKYSHIPLSMAFFHIPIPQYRNPDSLRVGQFREAVIGPTYDTGVLKALTDVGVTVVSVGHDHCNDFCALDSSTGESSWLCYGGGTGEGGYGGYPDADGVDFQRRVRIFEVDTSGSAIHSWKWVRGRAHALDRQTLVYQGIPVDSV